MEVIHLNQRNLAQRWHVSEATLERWRCDRKREASPFLFQDGGWPLHQRMREIGL